MNFTPEQILTRLDGLISEMTECGMELARAEPSLKAWEAAQRAALVDSGMSNVQAENSVRALPEWAERYTEVEAIKVRLVEKRARIEQGSRYFEAYRSERAAEKKAEAMMR